MLWYLPCTPATPANLSMDGCVCHHKDHQQDEQEGLPHCRFDACVGGKGIAVTKLYVLFSAGFELSSGGIVPWFSPLTVTELIQKALTLSMDLCLW